MTFNNSQKLIDTNKPVKTYLDSIDHELNAICFPLFQEFNIKVFCYTRAFKDGSHLFLDTNKAWRAEFLEKAFYNDVPHHQRLFSSIPANREQRTLWNFEPESILYQTMREKFDMWNGLSVCRWRSSYIEAWHFSTSRNNGEIIDLYMNHMDKLNQFILYFKSKAHHLINDSQNLIKTSINETFSPEEPANHLDLKFSIKKYPLEVGENTIFLSPRQWEIISLLSESKTTKEIARELELSPKTVEFYVQLIKDKTKCQFKTDLAKMFWNYEKKFNQY